MILKSISILNFKNIREASLDFSPNMNCFLGHNGVGKTNLLDAVYYLSFCRGAFNAVDSQLMGHGSDFFVIDGEYVRDDGDALSVYCGMKRGSKKHFKRDGKEYKRLSQHIGLIPLIMVSPEDGALILGGSEERRRLMDVVISQYDTAYMDSLACYGKALQQRNALLKMDDEPDASLLDIWEEEMAVHGERVYLARKDFVERMTPCFQRIYGSIADGRESVGLSYVSHAQRGPLLEVIRGGRHRDRAVGYSLHGVHRDDLEMSLGGYQIRKEGSQGQSKTFVIALKLAQFDFLKSAASGATPLLLLDDIFDKLDARRVERIVELVSTDSFGQIFITDTNRDHLDSILGSVTSDYRLFDVADGEFRIVSQ